LENMEAMVASFAQRQQGGAAARGSAWCICVARHMHACSHKDGGHNARSFIHGVSCELVIWWDIQGLAFGSFSFNLNWCRSPS
jgi:hypothetical protein